MFFGLLFLTLQAVAQQPPSSTATDSLPVGQSTLANSSSVHISQQGSNNRVVILQQGMGFIEIHQQSDPATGAQQIGMPGNQISLTVEAGTQTAISQQGPGPQVIDIHHTPAAVGSKARRRSRPVGHK